ncbi:MAG: hypothetical protein ABIQ74_07285 [Chitinophagales bacterium]
METKDKKKFKAVEYMREVRNDLADLYHSDRDRYFAELKQSIDNFLKQRDKQQLHPPEELQG